MFRPATIKEIECLLSTQGKDTASLKETCQADLAVVEDEVGCRPTPRLGEVARLSRARQLDGAPCFARLPRGGGTLWERRREQTNGDILTDPFAAALCVPRRLSLAGPPEAVQKVPLRPCA